MAQLAPSPKFRAVGADGLALVGGKVYTYTAGTSTPKSSFTTQLGNVANVNPVILDARGEADIWLAGNYKVVLTTAADVTVWTVDNVRDLSVSGTLTDPTILGALEIQSIAVTWLNNPTHSGNHHWSGTQNFDSNVTIGDNGADTLVIHPAAVQWQAATTVHAGNHSVAGNFGVGGTLDVSGVATFNANPAGNIIGFSYTPTLTNVTNVAASTAYACRYTRIGPNVIVSGKVSIDPTAATTATAIDLSLPIASALASEQDLSGTAACPSVAGYSAAILANTVNDRATISFVVGADVANRDWFFTFQYVVA